jgi:hypothetical protein
MAVGHPACGLPSPALFQPNRYGWVSHNARVRRQNRVQEAEMVEDFGVQARLGPGSRVAGYVIEQQFALDSL